MNEWRDLFILVVVATLIGTLYSCKDFGAVPPSQPTTFSASNTDISVAKGLSAQVTISGGTLPYLIKTLLDSTKVTVSLNSSVLTITGNDTGNTSIVLNDSKTPIPDSVIIRVTVLLPTVLFSNQIQPIFNSYCITCHGSNGALNLAANVSFSNLVNVKAQSSCTSLKRVLPNDASNSMLYRKVSGSSCGARMPLGASLSSGDIALIRDWINQGAQNN